ncbi:hypothetical protein ONZ45_g19551 [Pleurotus djamor]|nr:hypothetical protein ONZ45_g19551 [Pleurotus djamor]
MHQAPPPPPQEEPKEISSVEPPKPVEPAVKGPEAVMEEAKGNTLAGTDAKGNLQVEQAEPSTPKVETDTKKEEVTSKEPPAAPAVAAKPESQSEPAAPGVPAGPFGEAEVEAQKAAEDLYPQN